MSLIIFYGKQDCATNTRQKELLREAGNKVIERDLLNHEMSEEDLQAFFKKMPFTKWFNPNAPQIKNSEIIPSQLNEKVALELLMKNPILIRRPLIVIGNKKLCGFNQWYIEKLLGTKLSEKAAMKCSSNKNSVL